MDQQIILGMGAGQCGAMLLAQILDKQPNTNVTHEQPPLLSWEKRPGAPGVLERLERILNSRKERFVGDVASFYLPYATTAIEHYPDIRMICLRRPQEEVVEGFCQTLDRSPLLVNHWAKAPPPGWHHDPLWSRVFPKYDTQDREEGIRRYWTEYYERADELARRHPENIRVWDTEILTSGEGVREVLSFAGIPYGDQVVITGRRPDRAEQAAQKQSPPRSRHPLDPRKCVILVPFSGFIHQECDDALKELERRGYQVRRVGGYAAIDQGRNQMATDALLDGFEETLWIDSDIGFHPDAIDQLRSHDLPIVCGVYPQKGKRALACHVMPGAPQMVFGKRGKLQELLYAGTGFLLIRREVYLSIQRQLELPVCNERFGHPMFPFFLPMIRSIEEGHWYLAEDYAFCHRARQCGYKIFADTSIRLWHIGKYRYSWEDAGVERQRFDTFTLNFGSALSSADATRSEKQSVLQDFAAQYAWPLKQPQVPPFPQRNKLDSSTQQLLAESISPATRLIVDVGSSTGRATRFFAGLAPEATVIAVDHWRGSVTDHNDPGIAPMLPNLYETFLSECWNYRDQVIPVKSDFGEGLERIGEAGMQPNLIYFNGSHAVEELVGAIRLALDIFPQAVLLGDDHQADDMRLATLELAREYNLSCEVRGGAWRLTKNLPVRNAGVGRQ